MSVALTCKNKTYKLDRERSFRMKTKFINGLAALSLVLTLCAPPAAAGEQAATSDHDGLALAGSFFLTLLYLPLKAVTCVGTQAVGAVAYAATYGVAGSYDGETNGREIGHVARSACGGSWIISPDQVKKDYQ
jgi:hypothetical protein